MKSPSVRLVAIALVFGAQSLFADIVYENAAFRLVLGNDARARSLVVKETGEECLNVREPAAIFAATQIRPFNNETKLANPNKRTTYLANRLRQTEEGELVVGFETAPYEARVSVRMGNGYVAFELKELVSNTTEERQYGGLQMDVPPVDVFRVLQLSVRERKNFGDWSNTCWDERAAVSVMGTTPLADVSHEKRPGGRCLYADLAAGRLLRGGSAALVVGADRERFLDAVAELERDFKLPRGVESRRDSRLNASILWTENICPANVDDYISIAKRGGFRMMLVYYRALFKDTTPQYGLLGDYDWREEFPEGEKTLAEMLAKIKSAGITPGLHALQTHIGLRSRYVTPVADYRLNKKRLFTLSQAVAADKEPADLFVEENPLDSPRHAKCRVLQFGGELFSYESYVTKRPYRFTGVRRSAFATRVADHPAGEVGGVLDISEFGARSCYLNQDTSLQDEIAEKIRRICDAGMEFCYFDGSEGVNPPCNINVALSQFRVVSRFAKMPLFTEGAAKSHFGWHLQAGANAFDIFAPEVFKEKIVEYPMAEAPMMRKDFTRVDFGWWRLFTPGEQYRSIRTPIGTQPDMWEYGTSKAAAWDCPSTIQFLGKGIHEHPRGDDLLETMRRWEDVRARGLLTAEQKEMLKDSKREFHLESDGYGGYVLLEWKQLEVAGGMWTSVRAFLYERAGKRTVVYWHVSGKAELQLPSGLPRLEAGPMRSWTTDMSVEAVRGAFAKAKIFETDEGVSK